MNDPAFDDQVYAILRQVAGLRLGASLAPAAEQLLQVFRAALTDEAAVEAACRSRFGEVWDHPTPLGPTEIGREGQRAAMRGQLAAACDSLTEERE